MLSLLSVIVSSAKNLTSVNDLHLLQIKIFWLSSSLSDTSLRRLDRTCSNWWTGHYSSPDFPHKALWYLNDPPSPPPRLSLAVPVPSSNSVPVNGFPTTTPSLKTMWSPNRLTLPLPPATNNCTMYRWVCLLLVPHFVEFHVKYSTWLISLPVDSRILLLPVLFPE